MTSPQQPLVSFVVLCYNHEHFLGECLNSILSQKGDYPFEIIFVDDASTDGSRAVARTFNDPRINFIFHEKNQGHIATVHDGLRAARGEFVVRVDSDDRYREHFLSEMLGILRDHPEVGVAFGNVAIIDKEGAVSVEDADADKEHGGKAWQGNVLTRLLEKNFICAPTVVARRESWLKALPVPKGLAFHDWYFTTAMAREHEFYYTPRVVADYRIHPNNMHTHNARSKVEEVSIFRLLAQIYGELELTPELEQQKQGARGRVYGAQFLDMADKYFWYSHVVDARRCYLLALRNRPLYLAKLGVMRRLIATFIGLKRYEASKSVFKAARSFLRALRN